MTTFTLSQEQYEALVALARAGAPTVERTRVLDKFLQDIEASNGVTRSLVWIQWQETDQPLPPSAAFPTVWPPELRYRLELLTRPISKADVLAVVASKAKKPTNILCTRDPAAVLGWTAVNDFFTQ